MVDGVSAMLAILAQTAAKSSALASMGPNAMAKAAVTITQGAALALIAILGLTAPGGTAQGLSPSSLLVQASHPLHGLSSIATSTSATVAQNGCEVFATMM